MLRAKLNPSDHHKLSVFPPKIASGQVATAELHKLSLPGANPISAQVGYWKLSHGDELLGTNFIGEGIQFRFPSPGRKLLVATADQPAYGSVLLAQAYLQVLDSEDLEIAALVHETISAAGDHTAQWWFDTILDRHRGQVGWQEPLDAMLRQYLAADNPPAVRRRAFGLLARLYREMLIGIARGFFRDGNTVDDVVQAALSKGLANLDTYKVDQRFGPWIGKITRNHCHDITRHQRRELTYININSHHSDNPVSSMYEEDEYAYLKHLLNLAREESVLSEREFLMVSARYAEGLSYIEIADRFGIKAGGPYQTRVADVRRHLARAIEGVRQFRRDHDGEGKL